MKLLLFDQNLSPRLVERLADIYPGSIHVSTVGFSKALDKAVWEHARQYDYMVVTKDADFSELGLLLGFPPKVMDTSGELLDARYGDAASRYTERGNKLRFYALPLDVTIQRLK